VGITAGPDGNLWFTEFNTSKIGRMTPGGVIAEFPIPSGGHPFGITRGSDGNLWFTEGNHIGRITTSGVVTEFFLPAGGSSSAWIITGPDGNLWFPEEIGGQIGRITTSGTVTEFPILSGGTHTGIAAGSDGNLWFTDNQSNKIGRITTTGVITEFPIPTSNGGPYCITAGPDNNLWFTENLASKIGRITPSGAVTEFTLPAGGGAPTGIVAGPDGNLWFIDWTANKLGKITTAGVITEFPIPTSNSGPQGGMAIGPDGNLWFTEIYANNIAKVSVAPSPRQWTVAQGGNGHWYQLVNEFHLWPDARAQAAAMGGYLATLTSAGENDWVAQNILPASPPGTSAWIGGADFALSGEWRWVEGPEAGQLFWSRSMGTITFSNWGSGEPNNCCAGPEFWLSINPTTGKWLDLFAAAEPFVVEFDHDPRFVIANYQADFQGPTPKVGWHYLWNSTGAFGNPTNYTPLVYCGLADCNAWGAGVPIYDLDGGALPRAVPAFDVDLAATRGHPGQGTGQASSVDRFAIAAYTFSQSGHASITGSSLTRVQGAVNGDIQLFINIDNGPLLFSQITTNTTTFDIDLGVVVAGQTLYVGVGPDGSDFSDSFSLQFLISQGAPFASGNGTIQVSTNIPGASFDIEPGHYVGNGPSFSQPNVPAGTYTISYLSVAGCSTAPPSETKVLTAGTTLSFVGTYQGCTGTIEIDSNIANATFTISRQNGVPVHGGGPYPINLPNMPLDKYTVAFDLINGYTTPTPQTKTLNVGALTLFPGNYVVNGTAGLGRITITTNLDAANFSVRSTSNTSFVSFNRGGKFFDTLVTVPAGTYQISFTPVPGYFTPPDQTLTLNPSSTIQFLGVYRRLIVALFTGFSHRPISTSDGVTYPDLCDVSNCPGIAALARELRQDPALSAGLLARTFTFYDANQFQQFPPVTTTPGCTFSNVLTFVILQSINPECIAPSTDDDHLIAQDWIIKTVAPTPDDRIVVVGHSYGGNRARLFAQQLANRGYAVDGLVTIDPIDWDSCHLIDSLWHVIDLGCDFSDVARQKPDSVRYVLSYTQTQSDWLKGYHLATPTFAYPYTVLNDPNCLPDPLNFRPDNTCSHGSIAGRPDVHEGVIQISKAVKQASSQPISGLQTSNITTSTATISWNTQDDTAGGKVIVSQQSNFSTNVTAQEINPLGPVKSHAITISGLLSNTTYYFKVQVVPPTAPASIISAVEWFRTTPSVPSVRAVSPTLTVGTAVATLEFILTDAGTPVTGVSITSAKIGAASALTQLPVAVPDLGPVQSPLVSLVFPTSIGSVGSTVVPVITLKYSGGTITVGVPPTKIQ